jgi:ribosomal protein S24E
MRVVMEKTNELLKRKEIIISANYDSNPGFVKVQEDIAKKFNVNHDLVVVKGIHGGFGTHDFKIDAFIYDSVKDKEIVEPKKKDKNKTAEAASAPAGGKK